MPPIKNIKGIDVKQMSKKSNIVYHIKDPIRYPKVQCGYEGLTQVMFATQTNNMMKDLVDKMIEITK